jgi:hypothetical protein
LHSNYTPASAYGKNLKLMAGYYTSPKLHFGNFRFWLDGVIAQVYLKADADNSEGKQQNQTPFNQQRV